MPIGFSLYSTRKLPTETALVCCAFILRGKSELKIANKTTKQTSMRQLRRELFIDLVNRLLCPICGCLVVTQPSESQIEQSFSSYLGAWLVASRQAKAAMTSLTHLSLLRRSSMFIAADSEPVRRSGGARYESGNQHIAPTERAACCQRHVYKYAAPS